MPLGARGLVLGLGLEEDEEAVGDLWTGRALEGDQLLADECDSFLRNSFISKSSELRLLEVLERLMECILSAILSLKVDLSS